MSSRPPSRVNWAWVGARTSQELCSFGTDPKEIQWVRRVYAWFYPRMEPSIRATLPPPISDDQEGPPAMLFPVLATDSDGHGRLGFVTLTLEHSKGLIPGEDALRAAQGAASAVADWFRQLNYGTAWPRLEILLEGDPGGTSAGLSALVLALGSMLGVTWPDDLCATGSWHAQGHHGRLEPVEAQTLPIKVGLARAWGYRRLLVVEGQDGIPDELGMEIIVVPADPRTAILTILARVYPDTGEKATAEALAVFDTAAMRGQPEDRDLERILDVTWEFTKTHTPALARHFAHDIRSRALLHAGRTAEADQERKGSLASSPQLKPDGWVGDYLRWHQPAHHAVLALDMGLWEDDAPEHTLIDDCISDLEKSRQRGRGGLREMLAELYLRNTRGRRREFLGRWHLNRDRLLMAWQDRTALRGSWSDLVAYSENLGLHDGELRRQHNQCMDVLASFWDIEGRLPDKWGYDAIRFWPDSEQISMKHLNAFDLANFLRWKYITGREVTEGSVEKVLARALQLVEASGNSYPTTLVFETIIRYHLGAPSQCALAGEVLSRSTLFSPDLSPRSILTLLAVRACQLLVGLGMPAATPVPPEAGTRLAQMAGTLKAQPETIVVRCPY